MTRDVLLTMALLVTAVSARAQPSLAPTPELLAQAIADGYRENSDALNKHCDRGLCVMTPYVRVAEWARAALRDLRPRPAVADVPPEMVTDYAIVTVDPYAYSRCTPSRLMVVPATASRKQKVEGSRDLETFKEPVSFSNKMGGTWESYRLVAKVPLAEISPSLAFMATFDQTCVPQERKVPMKGVW